MKIFFTEIIIYTLWSFLYRNATRNDTHYVNCSTPPVQLLTYRHNYSSRAGTCGV